MENKKVRVTPSPKQFAAADLREAGQFVKKVTYDYSVTERTMTRSAEKIMRKCM